MKLIYWILLIVVALILLGLGIYYFYFQKKSTLVPTSPSPSISTTVSPSSSTTATTQVKIFMIAMNDNGASGIKIGCGDSAVAVTREAPQTQAVLRAAMEQLVSIKDKYYGESGLYNPLYQSNLTLQSAVINNGKATVKFTGTLTLVGTCEDARIEAQFMQTALQFNSVSNAEIFINGKNLKDLISQKG